MSQPNVSLANGGPDYVIDTAVRSRNATEEYTGTAQELVSVIRDAEGRQPWGTGKYAEAFLKNYEAASKQAQEALIAGGKALSQYNDNVISAVTKLSSTDSDNSDSIGSTLSI